MKHRTAVITIGIVPWIFCVTPVASHLTTSRQKCTEEIWKKPGINLSRLLYSVADMDATLTLFNFSQG